MSRFNRESVHDFLPLILDFFTISDYIFWNQVSKIIVELTQGVVEHCKIFQPYSILRQFIEIKDKTSGKSPKIMNACQHIFNELESAKNKKRYFIVLLENHIITQHFIQYANLSSIKIFLDNMEKYLPKPKKQIVLEDIAFFPLQAQVSTIKNVAIRYPELLQDAKETNFSFIEVYEMEKKHETGAMLLEAYSQSEKFRANFFSISKDEILKMNQQQLRAWICENSVAHCVFF